jgi:hypothetical protein
MVGELTWEDFSNSDNAPQVESSEGGSNDTTWGDFQTPSTYQGEPDPTQDESTWGYLLRLAVSGISRAGERYLGRYGDIEKLAKIGLSKFPGAMGYLGTVLKEMVGQEGWDRFLGLNDQMLPTSEDVKGLTMAALGDYTNPRTENERRFQDYAADLGSHAGGRTGTLRTTLINRVGIPVASNVAKNFVKDLGFDESTGDWTKLATMTALSLLNNVNAPAYAAQLMNEGRAGFGPNVSANIQRYENSLNRVGRGMYQGDPRSALAQQQIAGIRNDIANGQTSMRDLMNRYDSINAAKRDRGLFELGRADRRAAIRNIDQVRDAVRSEIEILGQVNPDALASWQGGVRAFSVIHRSQALSNAASRFMNSTMSKTAVATLFGAGALKAPLTASGASVGASALYKGGQLAFRVWNDPNLANYYWNAMGALAQEDAALFAANFNKLNDAYEKKYGESKHKGSLKLL